MADCKIVNEKVSACVTSIQNLAKEYASAGSDFETAFKAAIAEMEGDSKDAMEELFNKSYKDFVTSTETGIPAMINGLASLLESNRDNFEKVDGSIAQSIRNGGQQG
jgi:thioredoxin-like negative regulator of GroEL